MFLHFTFTLWQYFKLNEHNMTCRICLGSLEVPINLFEGRYKDLLEVLQRLLNFQVHTEEGQDFNVCCFCHGKLVSIFEFQTVCLKSLDHFRLVPYIKAECSSSSAIELNKSDDLPVPPLIWTVETKVSRSSKIDEGLSTKQEVILPKPLIIDGIKSQEDDDDNDSVYSPFADNSDADSDYKPEEDSSKKWRRDDQTDKSNLENEEEDSDDKSKCVVKTKRRSYKVPSPFGDVAQAIREVNNFMSDLKNAQCVFCDFVGVNAIALRIHMKRTHKTMTNWCERCNQQTEDLQAHRKALRCNIWQCKLCLKEFMWTKTLRKHLRYVHGGDKYLMATKNLEPSPEDYNFKTEEEAISEPEETYLDSRVPLNHMRKYGGSLAAIPRHEVLQAIKEVRSYISNVDNRQCIFCEFLGRNATALRQHMTRTHGNIKYWCKYCNMQVDHLPKHKSATKCYVTKCKFCTKQFGSRDYFSVNKLLKHLRYHGRFIASQKSMKVKSYMGRRYEQYPKDDVLEALANFTTRRTTCVHCNEPYPSLKYLIFHMRKSHRSSLPNWCKQCNILTEDMQVHLEATKCLTNRCVFCNRNYCKPRALAKHLKLHYIPGWKVKDKNVGTDNNEMKQGAPDSKKSQKKDSQPNNECTICHKNFHKLKLHMYRKHSGNNDGQAKPLEKYHLCPICGKTFNKSVTLEYHMSIHADTTKKYKCSICGRYYRSAFVLRRHEKIHKYSFVCHICGKHSMAPITHKKHMETHEEGPARCEICDKVYTRPGRLKLHMREHTGENQFNCIPCGKSFHIKSLLRYHMRIHNEEKPYKCSFCGKCFAHVTTHRKHEHTHTGVKPFKCNICPYKALQSYSLTIHMKQHPEDAPQASKPHKCLLCPKSFSTNSVLLSHKANCHNPKK